MNNQQAKLLALQVKYGTANFDVWSPYPQPFYDKVVYPPAGVQQIQFYATPNGGVDPNGGVKSLEDTNVQIPRQLGQNFLLCYEIRMGIFFAPKSRQPNAIATDTSLIYGTMNSAMPKLFELFNRGTLTLSLDSKIYGIIDRPFIRCPAGIGLNFTQFGAQAAAGPAVQAVEWIQNNADDANVYNLGQEALFIGPTQTINATLTWPDGPGPVFTGLVDGASPVIKLFLALGGYMFKASQ